MRRYLGPNTVLINPVSVNGFRGLGQLNVSRTGQETAPVLAPRRITPACTVPRLCSLMRPMWRHCMCWSSPWCLWLGLACGSLGASSDRSFLFYGKQAGRLHRTARVPVCNCALRVRPPCGLCTVTDVVACNVSSTLNTEHGACVALPELVTPDLPVCSSVVFRA
jgi:hypothetical protein